MGDVLLSKVMTGSSVVILAGYAVPVGGVSVGRSEFPEDSVESFVVVDMRGTPMKRVLTFRDVRVSIGLQTPGHMLAEDIQGAVWDVQVLVTRPAAASDYQ